MQAQRLSEALWHILLSLFSGRILLIQQNNCLDAPEALLSASLPTVGFQKRSAPQLPDFKTLTAAQYCWQRGHGTCGAAKLKMLLICI